MSVETGPNASTSCTRLARPGIVAAQQERGEEGARCGVRIPGLDRLEVAEDELRLARDPGGLVAHVLALGEADERAHGHALLARVADDDLGQRAR